jgi:hypothetical protein
MPAVSRPSRHRALRLPHLRAGSFRRGGAADPGFVASPGAASGTLIAGALGAPAISASGNVQHGARRRSRSPRARSAGDARASIPYSRGAPTNFTIGVGLRRRDRRRHRRALPRPQPGPRRPASKTAAAATSPPRRADLHHAYTAIVDLFSGTGARGRRRLRLQEHPTPARPGSRHLSRLMQTSATRPAGIPLDESTSRGEQGSPASPATRWTRSTRATQRPPPPRQGDLPLPAAGRGQTLQYVWGR